MDSKIIITISGFTKSKKSSISRIFSHLFDSQLIEMSAPFRKEMKGKPTLTKLLEGLDDYRERNGLDSLAKKAIQEVEHSDKEICIISGVRSICDYNEICSSGYTVYSVFVHSNQNTRHKRLERDHTSIAKDSSDYALLDKQTYKEGISKIARQASYTIINEPGYPIPLFEQVYAIADEIHKQSQVPLNIQKRGKFMNNEGVTIIKLPVYDKEYKGEKDIISRIVKSKGELATISIDTINYLAYVDFPLDGKPRANHYHEEKDEYLYLIKGKVKLFVRQGGHPDAEIKEYLIDEGTLINMHPGFAHAYVTIEEGFAVEFSPTTYDVIERDKVRDYVIE